MVSTNWSNTTVSSNNYSNTSITSNNYSKDVVLSNNYSKGVILSNNYNTGKNVLVNDSVVKVDDTQYTIDGLLITNRSTANWS